LVPSHHFGAQDPFVASLVPGPPPARDHRSRRLRNPRLVELAAGGSFHHLRIFAGASIVLLTSMSQIPQNLTSGRERFVELVAELRP
jgi:hypothetical protein